MPKQGMEGLGELLGDLFKELSPLVRGSLFTGLGLGVLATIALFIWTPDTGVWYIPLGGTGLGFLLFLLFVPAMLGAFVGCIAGVIIELLIGKKEPPSNKRGGRGGRDFR